MVVFISTEDVIIKRGLGCYGIEHSKTDVMRWRNHERNIRNITKDLSPEKLKFSKNWNNQVRSSNVWNNAGTGHSALCELNYTKKIKMAVLM